MNVAVFGPRFSPNFDGVGDHAAFVTESLVRAGHEVLVITESREARPRCELVRVKRWNVAALWAACAALARRPLDVALFEYTPFNFGPRTLVPHVVAALLRLRGVAVGTFMHEGFYRPRGTNPMPLPKAALLGIRDALIAAASNGVFAASRERADAIVAAVPFLRSRIHVVPIGANIEPAPAERWTPPAGPPYRFITFGVVAPRRRIDLAIALVAAARARGIAIELAVVGRIYDTAYAERCVHLARELGVAERVRFTRELESAEVTREFMRSHLALHALFEGAISSSGSLLAVLAHGVPLLAVRTPRDERAFDDLAAFTSEDPETMLDDALALLSSPDGGAALGRRARERYERDYAWDRIAERALDLSFGAVRRPSHARA